MAALRHHLLRRRWLAIWLVAAAMVMRVAVPGGYMVGSTHGALTLELCSGQGPMTMVMPMPGMGHHSGKTSHGDKADAPCAFAALSTPSLAAADPLLIAAAVAYILLTTFRAATRPPVAGAAPHLRPPLRGPPAHA